MISFKIITEENKDSILSRLSVSFSEKEEEALLDLISSFDLSDEDTEIALSYFSGCALVRIFDMGRYLFLFPIEISDVSDIASALLAIGEYAMREEIPLTICDVSAEELPLFSGFRHMDIDADDAECTSYRVRIKTECELIDKIPHIVGERVELRELLPEDIPLYAELCKDENATPISEQNTDTVKQMAAIKCSRFFFENKSSVSFVAI